MPLGREGGGQAGIANLKIIDLNHNSVKILGLHFSHNPDITRERNYEAVIKKIIKVTAMWKWRGLTLAGKVTIFKTMAISKIVFASFLSTVLCPTL